MLKLILSSVLVHCNRIVENMVNIQLKVYCHSIAEYILHYFTISKRCGHHNNVLIRLILPSEAGSLCNEINHTEIIITKH
jgi:hypothetical protein